MAKRLNLIYQTLANKHRIVHLDNLKRQDIIKTYL